MKLQKLDRLEGLRGIAAFVVLLHHLRHTFFHDPDQLLYQFFLNFTGQSHVAEFIHSFFNIFFDGGLAVYVFWMMSGYVISIKLFQLPEKQVKPYLLAVSTKRYFRLLIPVAGSILLGYFLIANNLIYNRQAAAILFPNEPGAWLYSFYQFNPDLLVAIKSIFWDTFFDFNSETSYNVAVWTMNPELYGSLAVFALFAVLGKSPKRYWVYAVLFVIAILLRHNWLATFIAGFMLSDFDYAISENNFYKYQISGITNFIFNHKTGLLVFLIGWMLLGGKRNFFSVTDIVLSFLLVVAVLRSATLGAFFEWKPWVWLGKISFSFYLLHLPVLCSLTCFLYLYLDLPFWQNILVSSAATIVFVLVIAHYYTSFVDRTAILVANRIGNYLSGRPYNNSLKNTTHTPEIQPELLQKTDF